MDKREGGVWGVRRTIEHYIRLRATRLYPRQRVKTVLGQTAPFLRLEKHGNTIQPLYLIERTVDICIYPQPGACRTTTVFQTQAMGKPAADTDVVETLCKGILPPDIAVAYRIELCLKILNKVELLHRVIEKLCQVRGRVLNGGYGGIWNDSREPYIVQLHVATSQLLLLVCIVTAAPLGEKIYGKARSIERFRKI